MSDADTRVSVTPTDYIHKGCGGKLVRFWVATPDRLNRTYSVAVPSPGVTGEWAYRCERCGRKGLVLDGP